MSTDTTPCRYVDGVRVPLSPAELAAFDAERAPRPPTAAQLRAAAADARWRRETGGITVSGISVHTDDRSKMMIMGARIQAVADPGFVTQWKGADGQFIALDAATITALSAAVLAHVDACFAREGEVLAAIDAGTVTTLAAIEQAFADVTAPWG
ncbi:DUF4376 domain-containing protein [Phreatobacter oligotrophus]|uniref:Uncharacterized protein DUF4376 n=1 Tax=Phreatobacter oligotrophus TaxID=1122261 RepID=A0A2T4ZIU2_9HYPH|nr:DUF4376 domain-containing protein [Phreatobacter oligotrophus]PTM61907.1 uncharacterized protein DUF4376 [Phreatobacter oligotrophus]